MQEIIIIICATVFFGGLMVWEYRSKKKQRQILRSLHTRQPIPSDPDMIVECFSQPIGDLVDRVEVFAFPFTLLAVFQQEERTFFMHLHKIDYSKDWYYNIGKVFKALQSCPSTDWQQVIAYNSAQLKMCLSLIENSDEEHPVSPNVRVWYAFSSIMDTMLINAGYKEKEPKS
jgi:hypothetical protein